MVKGHFNEYGCFKSTRCYKGFFLNNYKNEGYACKVADSLPVIKDKSRDSVILK